MTDTEMNEFCARELGWHQHHTPIATTCGDGDRIDWMNPKGELVGGEIPDFLNSESANAMLLEKMPNSSLTHLRRLEVWTCQADIMVSPVVEQEHSDRKRAIVLSFIEWTKYEH